MMQGCLLVLISLGTYKNPVHILLRFFWATYIQQKFIEHLTIGQALCWALGYKLSD